MPKITNSVENMGKIQLYQNDETDGFFICELQKK